MPTVATPTQASPPIRGFSLACTIIGGLYVLLGLSMVVRGAQNAMAQFEVPDLVLSSPHFRDFFHWVFVHMMVLGVMIVMLGRFVTDGRSQRIVATVLTIVELHYTYLDFRTSDSPLGNRLYHGSGSLVPPMIDVLVTCTFAFFAIRGWLGDRVSSSAVR
ncbi:MAG: hypothetical protein HOW73_14145 [Polyangiaceae bacterium]|nr:hypothetical protein [Polyangiaceae bacterium]